ncbi:hypothetical protein EAI_00204, partial [Harpegnathos saltator]
YFHANLCHVCKKGGKENILITCDRCFMVSYCSENHRKLHHPQHHDLCAVVEKYLKKNPKQRTGRFSTARKWYKSQMAFLAKIRKGLSRPVKWFETQMFIYPKSCLICRQQVELYTCNTCLSANYCLEHKEEFERQHNFSCSGLKLWLSLEFSEIQYEGKVPISLKFIRFPDRNKPYNDIITFITQYLQDEKGIWNLTDYIYSEYVSAPLTVYHGMKAARLLNTLLTESICIIHVIGACYVERNGLAAWEILLHLLPNIKVLIIVLIGTDIRFEIGMREVYCLQCMYNEKKFIYECCRMTYSDYLAVNPIYGHPNLIIVLSVFLILLPSWEKDVKAIQSQKCPLLLTT